MPLADDGGAPEHDQSGGSSVAEIGGADTTGTPGAAGPAPASTVTRGFLFADLRGYTPYVDAHGDHTAAELLDRCRSLVRGEVSAFRGAEIKTEGDSFYQVGVGVHAGETGPSRSWWVG